MALREDRGRVGWSRVKREMEGENTWLIVVVDG